jgi:hypothetical protein
MGTLKFGTKVGPFLDHASGRAINGRIWGTCEYVARQEGAPGELDAHVSAQLGRAFTEVTLQKLESNDVALAQLKDRLPQYLAEIMSATGLAAQGVHVSNLGLAFSLDEELSQQPAGGAALEQALGNRRVDVKLDIGGIRLRADSKKGFDTEGLQKQLVERGKSELTWSLAFAAIGLVVVIGVLGFGFYIYRVVKTGSSGSAPTGVGKSTEWDGKEPFICGGNDNVVLKGVTAKFKDTAVTAGGNCHLELDDMTLSGKVALEAMGNSVVTVKGGKLEGSEAAVETLGSAKVTLAGTKLTGKKEGKNITGP